MRHLLLSAAIGLSLLQASSQSVLNLSTLQLDTQSSYTAPVRTVTPTTDGIIVTYTFTDIKVDESAEYPCQYILSQNKFGVSHTLGTPAIPAGQDILPAGYDNGATLTLLNTEYVDVVYDVAPATGDVIHETDPRPTAPMNDYDGFYPAEAVSLIGVFESRPDEYAAAVSVCPVQYDYHNKTARIYKTISYKLDCYLDGSSRTEAMLLTDIVTSTTSGPRKTSIVPVNSNPYANGDYITESYLIVTTPKLHDVAEKFANWKRTLGYNTTVIYSDGEAWESYEEVKTSTNNFFRSHTALSCILIIGDAYDVPGKIIDSYQVLQKEKHPDVLTTTTDIYFGCLSDDELYAIVPSRVYVGRIPVNNIVDAQTVIDKIIRYESVSPSKDASFYKKGLFISYINKHPGEFSISTSEVIRDNCLRFGHIGIRNYFSDSTVYNTDILPPTASNNDLYQRYGLQVDPILMNRSFYEKVNTSIPQTQSEIANSSINKIIENGVSYVYYCGHGGVNNLGNANYTVNHIDALNNGDLQPVVFAPTCYAGRYNFTVEDLDSVGSFSNKLGYDRCFATEMLKKKNGGCIAIFACADAIAIDTASAELMDFAGYNCPADFLGTHTSSKGPILRLGGLMYRYKTPLFVSAPLRCMHLFGDPSMRMYNELPEVINNVTASITSNNGVSLLNITSENGAEYILWNTKTNDVIKFENEISSYTIPTIGFNPNDYKLCITGENRLPYITKLSDIITSSTYNGSITQVIKRMNTLYVYHSVSQANNTMFINSIEVYVYDNQGNFIGSQKASNDKYVSIPVGNRSTATYVVILKINGNTVDSKQVIA